MTCAFVQEWIGRAFALLDRLVGILRNKLVFLKKWSPSFAPKKWIYINGTCCILTAMFFLLGCLPEKVLGFHFAEMTYVPFNLIVCIIWFAEASLWMIFDEESKPWHKLGELSLAIFFVIDGLVWVFEWIAMETPLKGWEIVLYSAIDFLIYLFYLVLAIREEGKAALKQMGDQESHMKEYSAAGQTCQEKELETNFKLFA